MEGKLLLREKDDDSDFGCIETEVYASRYFKLRQEICNGIIMKLFSVNKVMKSR